MKRKILGIISLMMVSLFTVPVNAVPPNPQIRYGTTVVENEDDINPSTIDKAQWTYENRTFSFEKTYTQNISGTSKNNSIFSSSYNIDEDGYKGSIPLKNVTWNENWVRNRTQKVTVTEEIRVKEGSSIPYTKTVQVKDTILNKDVPVKLNVTNANMIRVDNEQIYAQDIGFFRWFSNNSSKYPGNSGSQNQKDWREYNSSPENAKSYYGTKFASDRGAEKYSEYRINNVWAWDRVYSANEVRGTDKDNGTIEIKYDSDKKQYYWNTDKGDTYGRGVTQVYSFPDHTDKYEVYKVRYEGTVVLEDYVGSVTGTAYYSGTLTKRVGILPAIINKDNDYDSTLTK